VYYGRRPLEFIYNLEAFAQVEEVYRGITRLYLDIY
jgi:hypothetical protein